MRFSPSPPFFQPLYHAKGLDVVLKAVRHQLVQNTLPGVTEGGVAQVVAEGHGFGQVLVQPKAPGNGPGHPVHLQRMGQAGPVMIPFGRQKYLRLMLQPPERLAVQDPVPVTLKHRAYITLRLLALTALGILAQGGKRA